MHIINRLPAYQSWVGIALLLSATGIQAQFELPATDIWLVQLQKSQVVSAENLTDRDGYDNQPAFSHAGNTLFYSHGDLADDGLGYTDIWQMDVATKNSRPVASTPTSEFSATPIPASPGLSVVRVQPDGAQQLWSIFPTTEQPERQLVGAEPVGYHVWLDHERLALFILGEQQNQLEVWNLNGHSGELIHADIGRGMGLLPYGDLLYLQSDGQMLHWPNTNQPGTSLRMPENSRDFAIASDASIWTGVGSKLYRLRGQSKDWELFADLAHYGIDNITRLTFKPGSLTTLALVSSR